jgi:hypothetical protein
MADFLLGFLRFDVPGAETWFPVVIGLVVSAGILGVHRLAFARPRVLPVLRENALPTVASAWSCSLEKRLTLRRNGNPTQVYVACSGHKEKPGRGYVLDRSLGGLRLMLDEEFRPGARLAILPVKAPEMTPWVEIESTICQHTNQGWEVGCRFVKTPPFSVLLMFG